MTEKKWYVYLLCDPDTQEPFYVGKGSGNRMYYHEQLYSHDNNLAKKQAIRRIHDSGKEVLKKVVAEFDDEQDAYVYEWAMMGIHREHITNIQLCGHASGARTFSMPDGIWGIKELRRYLGCAEDVARRLIHERGLPHIQYGKNTSPLRFRPEEVEKWVIQQEVRG